MQICGKSIGLHKGFLAFAAVFAALVIGLQWAFPDQRWIGLYIFAITFIILTCCIKVDGHLWWRSEQFSKKGGL
jgi:hypothetical protein